MVMSSDNTTVVAYIKKRRVLFIELYILAKDIFHWAEQFLVFLTARYNPGKRNFLANQLSCPNQVFLLSCCFFLGCLTPSARSLVVLK